jgi:maltokinase
MSNGSFAELLAAWLPAQRWFAGSGAIGPGIVIKSDVRLAAGEPELRHLIVDATVGAQTVRYQVPVGLTGQLRPELSPAAIGTLGDGRVAYDAAMDPELTAILLDGIASQRCAGPIRFRAEPGAAIDPSSAGRTSPASASNTSVVYGDKAILKLLRRPSGGHHPDLEIPAALARAGSRLVAAPLGWMEMAVAGEAGDAGDGDEPTLLAILSEYFAHSADGWSLAIADLRSAEPDFTAQARTLGQATARLHAELAAAFGAGTLPHAALVEMTGAMVTELTEAVEVVPEIAAYRPAIMSCYARLAGRTGPVAIQRIHGDYHLAQVLGPDSADPGGRPGAPRGWVVLDFEGEPSSSLTRRRAFAPPQRDVAGMLRSFDYVARHQVLAGPDDKKLRALAPDWVRRCQDAFCVGYGEATDEDPRHNELLLRALLLQKAVYEAVYEARHRPGWLPIPLHAIAEEAGEGDR